MSQHSSKGADWEALRKAVLDRDGWTCVWCGKDLTLEARDATVDHLIPKSQGGEDSLTNCVASCRSDNGKRGDRLLVRANWWDRSELESIA